MIYDATVEVICDKCSQSIQISPEYVYSNYSASSGHYDTSDEAIGEKLEREGWAVVDGKHLCEGCKPEESDEEEDEEE